MRPLKRRFLKSGQRLIKRLAPRTVRRISGWKGPSKRQLSSAAERVSIQVAQQADRFMDEKIVEAVRQGKLPNQKQLLERSQELKSLPHRLMIEYLVFISTRNAMNQLGIRSHRKELFEAEDRIFARALQRNEAGQQKVPRKDVLVDQEVAKIYSLLGRKKGERFVRLVNAKLVKARRFMEPELARQFDEREREREFEALTGGSMDDLLKAYFEKGGKKPK